MSDYSPESKARYFMEKAIFTLRRMIVEEPHNKENVIEGSEKLLGLLSKEHETLGEDFCIEKGCEIQDMVRDYLKYESKDANS